MPRSNVYLRMHKLQQRLVDIRLGSGALLLPKNIKRIHLRYAQKINGGHMGPRKFWRNELVRLQYHNPAIPMTVDNSAPQEEKAILSIHFVSDDSQQTSDSPTSSPAATSSTATGSKPSDAASTTRVETIDATGRTNSQILESLVRLTAARAIEPTNEDLVILQKIKERNEKSAQDAKFELERLTKEKREAAILAQARRDIATS